MGTKFFLVGLLLFIAAVATCCAIIGHLRRELKTLRCQLEATEKAKNEYAALAANLRKSAEIVGENRREADEKIDELHTGDAVDNALAGLSKRKN